MILLSCKHRSSTVSNALVSRRSALLARRAHTMFQFAKSAPRTRVIGNRTRQCFPWGLVVLGLPKSHYASLRGEELFIEPMHQTIMMTASAFKTDAGAS